MKIGINFVTHTELRELEMIFVNSKYRARYMRAGRTYTTEYDESAINSYRDNDVSLLSIIDTETKDYNITKNPHSYGEIDEKNTYFYPEDRDRIRCMLLKPTYKSRTILKK